MYTDRDSETAFTLLRDKGALIGATIAYWDLEFTPATRAGSLIVGALSVFIDTREGITALPHDT